MGVGVSQKSREGATSEADGAERRVEEGAKRVEERRGGNSEETICCRRVGEGGARWHQEHTGHKQEEKTWTRRGGANEVLRVQEESERRTRVGGWPCSGTAPVLGGGQERVPQGEGRGNPLRGERWVRRSARPNSFKPGYRTRWNSRSRMERNGVIPIKK